LVVLSYMGLPEYGIVTPAAQRIMQDLAPEEGVGPLRAVPFAQLQAGEYVVNEDPYVRMCPNLGQGCPELEAVFKEYTLRVNERIESGDLPNASAVMVIEDWQQNLKKIVLRIVWDDQTKPQVDGQYPTKVYEHTYYLHAERGGE
jgi:hypothetical protein